MILLFHRGLLFFSFLVLIPSTVLNFNNQSGPHARAGVAVGVSAFAAKKNNNNNNNKKRGKSNPNLAAASSNKKGFGAAPPTLEEVVKNFKTRLPEDAEHLPCPCGIVPGRTYGECCQPYHQTQTQTQTATTERLYPTTPLRVLQTRYSAFCYRLVQPIIDTTHPTCRDYRDNRIAWANDLNRNGMFDSFEFVELQVIGPEIIIHNNETTNPPKAAAATIDFKVRLRSKNTNNGVEQQQQQQGRGETVVAEKSTFLRDEDGIWSYASGEVRSEVEGLEDAILNQ